MSARNLLSRRRASPAQQSHAFPFLVATICAGDLAILAVGLLRSHGALAGIGWKIAVWACLSALLGLVPVASRGSPQLGMELPLLLGVGFLFGPLVGGLVALLGYSDVCELRGRVGLVPALFNRAQTSLSTMAAAAAFQLAGGRVGHWPFAALAAFLAIAADCIVNYLSVATGMMLRDGLSFREALLMMTLGAPEAFAVSYVGLGFLGLLLAETYVKLGVWGLVAFAIPIFLARQAFLHGRRVDEADEQLRERGLALERVSERVVDERREERLVVAAGLHDEVLPPIYKVHLMGQVLRQDLASGHLLALEEDLPELIHATQQASEAARSLIRNLRHSSIGTDGLRGTLRMLVRELESESDCRIRPELEEVGGSPAVQLVAYQVAREALRNAVRHSQATDVSVTLARDGSDMRLAIEDNGLGFEPDAVVKEQHFGLQLMRERVELAGGLLYLDSSPGRGTRITIRLPAEPAT
jgi:signal transduction histidine kinase